MALSLYHSLQGGAQIIGDGLDILLQSPAAGNQQPQKHHQCHQHQHQGVGQSSGSTTFAEEKAEIEAELVQGGNQLAAALTVKRHGVPVPVGVVNCRRIQPLATNNNNTSVRASAVEMEVLIEPRLLRFEFTNNLLLRGPQVRLVREFMAAIGSAITTPQQRQQPTLPQQQQQQQQQPTLSPARSGPRAQVQQLLMGAGKTTVVAPLLALLLASPNSLVLQVLRIA